MLNKIQSDCIALISIKPRFVEKILSGEKTFEFRRQWAKKNVDRLVIYSSSPVQRIVAIAKINSVKCATPIELIQIAKEKGDVIDEAIIMNYFSGKTKGYALELHELKPFVNPLNPKYVFHGFRPPQSFQYLSEAAYFMLFNLLDK